MLKILSPLEMVQRVDMVVTANVNTSGYTGSWVQPTVNAVGSYIPSVTGRTATFPTTAYKMAYVVWSEGNKRGATLGSTPNAGYSYDVSNTNKVTTIFGSWRGLTDQVVAGTSTTPGTLLTVATTTANQGKLTELTSVNISGLLGAVGSTLSVFSGIAVARVRNYYTWFVDAGVTYSGVWEVESVS